MVYRCDLADFFSFPGTHPRHDCRELLRKLPNNTLDRAMEALLAIEASLEEETASTEKTAPKSRATPKRSR